jgi:DinB family protein
MPHPLVEQLRFTRSEWSRALRGTPEADGEKRLTPMNSIGWIVGHLAWQEQRYWLTRAQGETPIPVLNELVANGAPASTPPLSEMLAAWREITSTADPWLDALTTGDLVANVPGTGPARRIGDLVQRVTYHYWFHTGEILAIRQILGHPGLPEFVGDIDGRAPYRPPA